MTENHDRDRPPPDLLAILPLRSMVVFPHAVVPLAASATSLFQRVVALSPALPDELANVVTTADSASAQADIIAAALPTLPLPLRQELLETVNVGTGRHDVA